MSELTAHEEHTLQELREKLNLWQRRLGLSDWTIRLRFADSLQNEHAQALTHIRHNSQIAEMWVMRPGDRQVSDQADADMESDLVHELVHIRMWPIDKDIPSEGLLHILREQAYDWMARALLTAERGE